MQVELDYQWLSHRATWESADLFANIHSAWFGWSLIELSSQDQHHKYWSPHQNGLRPFLLTIILHNRGCLNCLHMAGNFHHVVESFRHIYLSKNLKTSKLGPNVCLLTQVSNHREYRGKTYYDLDLDYASKSKDARMTCLNNHFLDTILHVFAFMRIYPWFDHAIRSPS